jgi:L-ascorbate metabolism protein UlaG (beta-lactamase superfamily)
VFVAPLGHRDLLTAAGAKHIVELDWWQSFPLTRHPSSAGVPARSIPTENGPSGLFPNAGGDACATSSEPLPSLTVTVTPSRHWSRRTAGGTNRRLWGGFYLQAAARRVWFLGDSGYDAALFQEVARRHGAPDLALIPIGAYEPRWFMRPAHMDPAEAVQTHRDCGARVSVAMHWGTFQLTDEGRETPARELAEARDAAGLTAEQFRVLAPGESLAV